MEDIVFKIEALGSDVEELLNYYLSVVFNTSKNEIGKGPQIIMNIVVKNTKQVIAESIEHEKYQLTIRQN